VVVGERGAEFVLDARERGIGRAWFDLVAAELRQPMRGADPELDSAGAPSGAGR
jgi:hypothetical protein